MAEGYLPCSQLQLGGDASLERRFTCPHLWLKWGQFCLCSLSLCGGGFPFCVAARLSAKLSVFYEDRMSSESRHCPPNALK